MLQRVFQRGHLKPQRSSQKSFSNLCQVSESVPRILLEIEEDRKGHHETEKNSLKVQEGPVPTST